MLDVRGVLKDPGLVDYILIQSTAAVTVLT